MFLDITILNAFIQHIGPIIQSHFRDTNGQ